MTIKATSVPDDRQLSGGRPATCANTLTAAAYPLRNSRGTCPGGTEAGTPARHSSALIGTPVAGTEP